MQTYVKAWLVGALALAIVAPPAAADPPTNTTPPAIVGRQYPPWVGSVLTKTPGVWTGGPISTQWIDCGASDCIDIAGATTDTYTVQPSDLGYYIAVRESATDPVSHDTVYANSVHTFAVVQPPSGTAPAVTVAPKLSGLPEVGETMSVTPGTWSGTQPIAISYEWRRCVQQQCVNIPGETRPTLTLTSLERGYYVTALVKASNASGVKFAYSDASPSVGDPGGGLVPVGPTQRALRRASLLTGKVPSAKQLLKHNGYPIKFTWRTAGTLDIRWTAARPGGAAPVTVATRKIAVYDTRRQKTRKKLRLTPAGRRLFKHVPHPTLPLRAGFHPLYNAYPVVVEGTRVI
ncbi:MAG: large repetitive protein [Solirubrobacteraceae bacterium]|nr:large repetitive protein [Solirubrobacteraceae bacterium]